MKVKSIYKKDKMAYPTKKKFDIDVVDVPTIGNEYLKYGMERIQALMINTDKKTNYLPRTISFEDCDTEIFSKINDGDLKLVLDGKQVPSFYLENERWGEFSKTWKFMDEDKNVPTPYITVRRSGQEPGTRLGTKWRIPQPRNFRYLDVPIVDDGQVINIRYKIPEPVNVDLIYEVRLFTKYRVDCNKYDELFNRTYGSRQSYIWLKGNPIPTVFESREEANTIENIDGDRFYVTIYNIRAMSLLQNEEEFSIVKTSRKPRISISVDNTIENIKLFNRDSNVRVISSRVSPSYRRNKTVATITNHFDTISHMISNINSLVSNAIYYVSDASDDGNISSGYAYYEFKGKNYLDIRDFRLMSSENPLSSINLKSYTWLATEDQTKYVILSAVANEIYQIDDFLVGGVKQINNTTISTETVTNDSVTIDIGTGTIPAGTTTYLEYFTKN